MEARVVCGACGQPQLEATAQGLLGKNSARERNLRGAHRIYSEMGATGHAERLEGQLSL
jgi:hypothetical protein